MKIYDTADVRNFAIVGHGGAGKTMLAEAMLACSGTIPRMGSITAGTTVSDYHDDEKQRQVSIHTSVLHASWLGRKFNLIDCPGQLDFITDSIGAVRVADFALIVVNAAHGIEVGTERVWDYATAAGIPKMIVLNGFDKENTNFEELLGSLRERFGERVFPLTLPINPGPGFNQLLDVMRSETITFDLDGSGKYHEAAAEGEWAEHVKELHREIIEYVAETDDSLLEKFFEEDGLSEEEMRAGMHRAVQEESFTPLFVASAQTDVGIARMMDIIAKYGSSPVDRKTVMAEDPQGEPVEVRLSDSEPVAYVFKTISEAHVGELSFFRVYSGEVRSGSELYNVNGGVTEKVTQLFSLNGKNRDAVGSLKAGDIGAVVKLRDTHTGNTLCSPSRPVKLSKAAYPEPVMHGALVLKTRGDEDKLSHGLHVLAEEDPTFSITHEPELGQTVLHGQGELHLQILTEALKRRFRVEVELRQPRVPYRETIRGKAEAKYRHKKQSGGAGQFAEVWMRIEPAPRDSGIDFTESLVGQNVDRVFVPSVEKGVKAACEEGILAGCPIVDVKIDFYDGKMHPVDSKDVAFQIAGRAAFVEAFKAAKPFLLEPIINVEVTVPEQYVGDVTGDLAGHHGRIMGLEPGEHGQVVQAQVPQRELYRYGSRLRAMTGGRATHTEQFSHYEDMPPDQQERVMAAAAEQ